MKIMKEIKTELRELRQDFNTFKQEVNQNLTEIRNELAKNQYHSSDICILPKAPFATKDEFTLFNNSLLINSISIEKLKVELMTVVTKCPKQSINNCWSCILEDSVVLEYSWSRKGRKSKDSIHNCAFAKVLEDVILKHFDLTSELYEDHAKSFYKRSYDRYQKRHNKDKNNMSIFLDEEIIIGAKELV